MYRSLARWCYQHRWLVVAIWVAAIVGANAVGAAVGSAFNGEFETPASESTRGFETVEEYFPGAGSSFGGSIVFQSEDGVDRAEVEAEMTRVFEEVDELDGVTVVSPYTELGAQQISEDGTIAFAQVNLANDVDQTESGEIGVEINELAAEVESEIAGLRIEVGGQALAEFEPPESELIGLAFAIVVLIVAFGSVLAMGLPIGIALAGVGTGIGLVTLLTNAFTIPDFAPLIGIMIGLGVGIDYALFIVTRYRELTRTGSTPEQAVLGAMDTAGRAVMFAGITVVLSLLGMLLIGLQFVAGLGIAAATTVAVTLVASMTLLPAMISLTTSRIEVTRWRGLIAAGFVAIALLGIGLGIPVLGAIGGIFAAATIVASFAVKPLREIVPPRRERPLRDTIAYRWSHQIQARPWTYVLLGGGVLLALSAPVLGLRLGFSDEGNFSEETTTRQAYELVAEGFGPGFNGPFLLAAEVDDPGDAATLEALSSAIAADPGINRVSPPFPSNQDDPATSEAFLLQIIPETAPQDADTERTVLRLRDDVIPPIVDGTGVEANLTGAVPANIDFSDFLGGRIIIFYTAVLGVSFLLLMMVFRSLLVPLKAVIMNMLSISAAYGVVVAIFQWGWFGGLTGIEAAPIEPFIPMMLFAIVFGLSMDYEVFLLSRIKEEYDRTGDAVNSVADGLAATARVISAAAAIMVVVFGSFLLEDDRIVKLFGTGLALAVLLDATLVRMLLVPATMELLGSRNWWIPGWLDRRLPRLNVEGPALDQLHAPPSESPPDRSDDEPDEVREPVPVS
ncbi:MAG: MMPL family transporter [Ilumatobacter sp.]|uniref:MMPL family transporter n=1 Tax=Ilumatobacter sp. TaxID=1967498 RepID=UPI002636ECFB|nr:MMPL family transporter [Ilumatobacter sp.]MDJ0769804.1 MMPL family transporter [Ilumatobacter sp.]